MGVGTFGSAVVGGAAGGAGSSIYRQDMTTGEVDYSQVGREAAIGAAAGGVFYGADRATSAAVRARQAWLSKADDLVAPGGVDLPTSQTWGRIDTLDDHFARHGADFGATSADDYARQASEFLEQPGTLTKIDPKTGVIRVYDQATEAFGSYNPTGTTRTFYVPDPAKHGYPTNLDYWNAQPG